MTSTPITNVRSLEDVVGDLAVIDDDDAQSMPTLGIPVVVEAGERVFEDDVGSRRLLGAERSRLGIDIC
ncbi:hypothetical protein [Natrialba asiatica]|uniref:Uncharacterized protein n=1 Tax=Natrialba asiatica (strain ATCC 700177 / DSM 12278 / JCM 9576 / FERM P-10747 / NBRC 102637 / 172P1) TaxID=29540 RepID=M0ATT2_NATA1|nr:hypothetical protein [Natrialba asiatica]ELZ00784.1 hypothetical protein C481_11135 [Natrialba asiatica DSM 12278]